MRMWTGMAGWLAGLALGVAFPATAAELKVLTAGAFKPVLQALQPEFEQRTGHRLQIENDTAGALLQRILNGERFDLVVLTPAALEQLDKAGKTAPGSAVTLAKVGIGVAVRRGSPKPDIADLAGLRRALIAARAVAYIDPAAGGSSGIYLNGLFERLALAEQIRPKAVLVPGGLVARRLLTGEADLALHQISEILAVPDAELVGPLPDEIQHWTVYAGALPAGLPDATAAQALLSTLGGSAAREVLAGKGMTPP